MMAAEASRAPTVREQTPVSAAIEQLEKFQFDGYLPFYDRSTTPTCLMRQAHGLAKVLGQAFEDNQAAEGRGIDLGLTSLNGNFSAAAFDGIASLVALAMFIEQGRDA